jgi:flagellar assembly protein FliH
MDPKVKFLFDRDFDDIQILEKVVARDQVDRAGSEEKEKEAEPEVKAPTFSEEDVAKAREEGYQKGRREGAAETMKGHEIRIAGALEKLASEVTSLAATQAAENETMRRSGAELVLAMVQKLFPSWNDAQGLNEVSAMAEKVLSRLFRETRIVVTVDQGSAEVVRSRLIAVLERRGFKGDLVVNGEAGLQAGTCHIEWSSGHAMRDTEALLAEIEQAVERNMAPDASGTGS